MMRKTQCLVLILVISLMGFVAMAMAGGPQPPRFDEHTMISVREVKPGMRGTGKSVFKGVEITEFGVEVLGVLPKANLGGDLVLIRVLDGPVVERDCGVVGGMSGSPVTINGRLLGAIAYTFGFSKEPIGGVTPIESMLNSYVEKPVEEKALTSTSGVWLQGRHVREARIVGLDHYEPFADDHTINLVPCG
ncbi:MAG: SpoIVB peptidase S55 domain-containing protein, partial [Candidatus Zipacnadales bacterium]